MASTTAPKMIDQVQPDARSRGWMREPLAHFLILGMLLFLASRLVTPDTGETEIVIDSARVERLSELFRLQTGMPPDAAEQERLIQDYIRDEVLFREARKLHLDDGDELVRRRLVQKMAFLVASSAEVPLPDTETLREYYELHAARFSSSPRTSFQQVYFSPDARGVEGARQAAIDTLARHGAANSKAPTGDRAPLPGRFDQVTRAEMQLALGQKPIVDALLESPVGIWSGPVESGYGWHLIRVDKRSPAILLHFDDVREEVEAAWLSDARQRAEQERLTTLTEHYQVIRQDPQSPAGRRLDDQ